MAKFKKNSPKSDSKLHMKSNKRKQKNKCRKIKKHEIHSLLINPYGKHISHPHVTNREISNMFNSAWNVEICDTPKSKDLNPIKHVNGKVKKCKRKKNKYRKHHEENGLSHSSLNCIGTFPTKCNGNSLGNTSWNIETNSVSPLKNVYNVKKRKKGKFVLKEKNKNIPSKVKSSSGKNLLGSILISDTDSHTEDDEPIERIFQNKYNRNCKLNVNFVNFNTENVKGESFKTSSKKIFKKKKLQTSSEDSDGSKIFGIKDNRDTCVKLNRNCNNKIERNAKSNSKPVKKCKKKIKKSKMEITDVSNNVKNNTEIEVYENFDPSKLNESRDSNHEIEILESINESSDSKENITSTTKNDEEIEIIENSEAPKFFVNLDNTDTEIEIVESKEIPDTDKIIVSDSDIEIIENVHNLNSNRTKEEETTPIGKRCQYYVLENVCIVILKHPTKLYFEGVLKASIIVGNVQIFGYTLTKEPQIIYSLAGASFLCFETCSNHNLLLPNEDLTKLGLNKNIIESLKPADCILKFEPYSLSKIHFIDNYIEQNFIPLLRENNEIEQFLKCRLEIENDTLGSIFKSNPQWNKPIQSIMSTVNSKTILCGGKNVGKSTLFRYTVNKLLNTNKVVLCLDFDIGQSEFSVPGCISVVRVTKPLLGPNYTHLQKPERSYFLGSLTVTNNMDAYLYGIKYILDYCSANPSFQNIPWVINTMGFVKDIGFSIMIHLARMIQPTHIIQINSYKYKDNYPLNLSAEFLNAASNMPGWKGGYNGYCTHELFLVNMYYKERISAVNINPNWEFRPNQLRNVCMISYVSEMIKNENQSLLEVQPVVTTMEDVKLVNSNVSETLIPSVFNGNFVALCREQKIEYNKVLYICEGFGIVRGIDNKDIYLLTPLNLQALKNVTHIILAAEPLPPSIYMNTKCVDCSVPYVSASTSNKMRTTVPPKRATYHIFKNYIRKQRVE